MTFEVTGTALDDNELQFFGRTQRREKLIRASLSHMSARYCSNSRIKMFSANDIKEAKKNPKLPSPFEQMNHLIILIGDEYLHNGNQLYVRKQHVSLIGCIDAAQLVLLVKEIIEKDLIRTDENKIDDSPDAIFAQPIHLSLDGWDSYEAIRKGKTSGRSGFIAMKFGDAVLDPIVSDHIKPSIKESLGLELVDLRDVERAGVIDNIMRQQIRESAFVLVDLTHENAGAYWEAGYAEGLGKPVIYICERGKFAKESTHFDTNHCTTVMWEDGKLPEFRDQLVATLKRSLEL